LEEAWCAVGFSGHGLKMAPVVGQIMAEMIVDGEAKTLDVSSLRLSRFEDNQPRNGPQDLGNTGGMP
jgi:glycine/D-amino acid oxidase-like deaminating enzyme